MAFPTAVNNQITDSTTQSDVSVVSSAPAMAMGSLYQAMAQSLATAAQNATANQQQLNTINDAATANLVSHLLK